MIRSTSAWKQCLFIYIRLNRLVPKRFWIVVCFPVFLSALTGILFFSHAHHSYSEPFIPIVLRRQADLCSWRSVVLHAAPCLTAEALCLESPLSNLSDATSWETWSNVSLPLIWSHFHSSLPHRPHPETFRQRHHPCEVQRAPTPATSCSLFHVRLALSLQLLSN